MTVESPVGRWRVCLTLLCALAALLVPATRANASVGYQVASIPVAGGKPVPVAIWYPSAATPAERAVGPFKQTVATNAPVTGRRLPLIIVSHGTGGSKEGHSDTALALAGSGFVVAAIEHTGDNYRDQSRATDAGNRPLELRRLVDFMLSEWDQRAAIDPTKIGAFGHSSGGFSVLALAGGKPDLTRVAKHCVTQPAAFECQLLGRQSSTSPAQTAFGAEARVKALVVAAPALGYTFIGGLSAVRQPVQLWRADDDRLLPAPHYADAVRAALPRKPDFHPVPAAGHFDFLAPCSDILIRAAPAICTSNPGFDRAAFHLRFNAEIVKFFRNRLGA